MTAPHVACKLNLNSEPWFYDTKPSIDEQDIENINEKIQLLLVVANEREFNTVRSMLLPIDRQIDGYIGKLYRGEQTYYIGKFGVLNSVLVWLTDMGSAGAGGSLVTISDAINTFEPYIVVLLGVGWGKGGDSQEIGDVLVARHIIPLQANQRIGPEVTVNRYTIPECTTALINRFQNNIASWKKSTSIKPKQEWNLFQKRKKLQFDVHIGDIVSGNFVLDNANEKSEILRKHPSAIGGDMEGWGLYVSTNRWRENQQKINWILVKSICDLGTDKSDQYQYLAAATASDFVHYIFRSEAAVRDLLPRVETTLQMYDNNSKVIEDVSQYSFMFTPVLTYDINYGYFQLVNLSSLMISFIESGPFRNYVETQYSPQEVQALLNNKDGLYIIQCGYKDKYQKWFNHNKMAKLYNYIVANFPRHMFPTRSKSIEALDTMYITPDVPFKTNHSVYLPYVTNSWTNILSGSILVMAHRGRNDNESHIANALYASNKVMYIIDNRCALGTSNDGSIYLKFCNKIAYCTNNERNIFTYQEGTSENTCETWTVFKLEDEYKEYCIL